MGSSFGSAELPPGLHAVTGVASLKQTRPSQATELAGLGERARPARRPHCGRGNHGTGRSWGGRPGTAGRSRPAGPTGSLPRPRRPGRDSRPRRCPGPRVRSRRGCRGPLRQGQHQGRLSPVRYAGGQRQVVDAAVVTAHDERNPAARERVQRGQGGQHVGGQAVVHEGNAVDGRHRRQQAGQVLVAVGGGVKSLVASLPGTPRAARHRRAISALRRLCWPSSPSGAIQPRTGSSVCDTHSTRGPSSAACSRSRSLSPLRAAVQVGPRLRAHGQLVLVVALHFPCQSRWSGCREVTAVTGGVHRQVAW